MSRRLQRAYLRQLPVLRAQQQQWAMQAAAYPHMKVADSRSYSRQIREMGRVVLPPSGAAGKVAPTPPTPEEVRAAQTQVESNLRRSGFGIVRS